MDLTKKPFYLNADDIRWVEETLSSMTLEEKIGQLFCPIGYSTDEDYLKYEMLAYHIGGLFFRDGPGEEMRNTFQFAQDHSRIPLLVPSNLEAGGVGAALDGTPYGNNMAVSAAGDPIYAYYQGKICCSEAAALGINWAFAPVVDLDLNDHNPITNVRTYGNDPEVVIANAKEYLRAAAENGMAAAVKHFPGDGVDERDQHLLTSVNSLSREEWDATYGHIYRELIDAGTKTVMTGHIAMPAYQNYYAPEDAGKIVPGSLSKPLLTNLLREKLGFNGLIISDATPMVGFTSAMPRAEAVPTAIENGCDMILFNKELKEDVRFMREGLERGILSEQRLEDANRRILALKASLKLHVKQMMNRLVPDASGLSILHCARHKKWAQELADHAVTLVKDTKQVLPLSPKKTKRLLLEILGDFPSNARVLAKVKALLEERGFAVTVYEHENFEVGVDNVTSFKAKYDAVFYVGNVENASNRTVNRLNWYTFWGQGNNVPWFANEVPVVFLSAGNPYHLLDVPMLSTYVNCYYNSNFMLEAAVSKICGESPFLGKAPTDPFCGREELTY